MSKIEWTDETWNPIAGCTRVSPGCQHCYAERMAKRQIAMGNKNYEGTVDKNGRWTGRINLIPEVLEKPLHWRKPRRVFVNSMSDLFHPDVPFEYIDQVFAVMALSPQHTFQVLTKRPERMFDCVGTVDGANRFLSYCLEMTKCVGGIELGLCSIDDNCGGFQLPNVHLGVSVENQATADERIPWLLKTPAAVRWISYEPALDRVDFRRYVGGPDYYYFCWICGLDFEDPKEITHECPEGFGPRLDGIVVGCESGPGARPMDLDWVRSVRDQCQEAGVAFFFKQMIVDGKKVGLPELDGKVWDEWPEQPVAQETNG